MRIAKVVSWILLIVSLLTILGSWIYSYSAINKGDPFNYFLSNIVWPILFSSLLILFISTLSLTYVYLSKVNKLISIGITSVLAFSLLATLLIYQSNNKETSTEYIQPQSTAFLPSSCSEQESLEKAKKCTVLIGTEDTGHGSGFFINPNYIVTNLHVVSSSENGYIDVWLKNGYEKIPIVGYSEKDDLAVLQTKESYEYCDWSNTDKLDLAETVFAFGWPKDPYGESTVTKGIFSRRLSFENSDVQMIQTDTPINPGNSGGPLVNKCGVVGVNTSKNAWIGQDIPSEGIGYAINANYARAIVENIVQSTGGGPIIPPSNPSSNVGSKSSNNFNYNQAVSYDYDSVIYWEQRKSEDKKMLDSWEDANDNQFVNKNEVKKLISILKTKIELAEKLWDGYTNEKITLAEAISLNNEYIQLHNEGAILSRSINIQGEQNVYVQCIKSWEELEEEYGQDFDDQKEECKNYLD